ncbi:DNA repair protein XRCC2 [Maniola hyperantus]|uniref:DNA repair protein XRCC2 n=1 Tax=Aphantopus hyperantus TaxID=2795564 RepID=UPI003749776E
MEPSRIKIESGIQMLARLTKKPGIERFYPIIFGSGPKQGDIIELYSDGNTSYLLTELICEALIPQELNGPETGVIIFNTDGNLYFHSVLNLLRSKIIKYVNSTNNASKYNINNVDAILNSTLKNLYVLEIFDATQFYLTIQNLENILTKHLNISLVVFHTLTAFYWSEQDFKIIKMDSYLKKLLSIIQKVVKDHKTTVLYSRPEYFSSSKEPINNLEPCCQHATDEQINYRIQIVYNNCLNFVNVRSYDNQFQKEFNLTDYEITWL